MIKNGSSDSPLPTLRCFTELQPTKQFVFSKQQSEQTKNKPLWPSPYNEDTPEALWKFLTECCWTYNEADKCVAQIPPHPFLRWLIEKWYHERSVGGELIVQKSRRIIVSWTLRGCELWSMGLNRESGVVCGLTYPKSANHVWRYAHLLREMQNRLGWSFLGSPKDRERGGNFMAGQFDQVMLPNGSMVESLNQEGDSFQGSGYSWVTMEEFCLYKNPLEMRAQAKIVTEGAPGQKGGFVVSISNASPNKDWQSCKDNLDPREVLRG